MMNSCVICGCPVEDHEPMCLRCYKDSNNPIDRGGECMECGKSWYFCTCGMYKWEKDFVDKYKDWPAEEPPPHKDDF